MTRLLALTVRVLEYALVLAVLAAAALATLYLA